MILKKPYAFFIKNFRLIHLILAIFVSYLLYRTYILLDFFNDYQSKAVSVVGHDLVSILFTNLMYIMPIIIIIVTISILAVMAVKKKSYLFYIIMIIIYVYTFIYLQIAGGTIEIMQMRLLDIRAVRISRDLALISFLFQIFGIIIVAVRATGFDITKFDFKQDLEDMEIDETDSEEFEVDINVDKNKLIRRIRHYKRMVKYKYQENKLTTNLIIIGALVFIGGTITYGILYGNRTLDQSEQIVENGFTMNIVNSYLTANDHMGTVIDEDYSFLILRIKTRSNGVDIELPTSAMRVEIGFFHYYPTLEYRPNFLDFGAIYEHQIITEETVFKHLIYKIPVQLVNDDMFFNFVSTRTLGNNRVRINYIDLDKETNTTTFNLGDSINFKDSVIGEYEITIENFRVANQFRNQYRFCETPNNCYSSFEYIRPNIITNFPRGLLRIQGNMVVDENIELSNTHDLFWFIHNFGRLRYEINGEVKYQDIRFRQVVAARTRESDVYYLEIIKEAVNANRLSIILHFRDQIYEYVLK